MYIIAHTLEDYIFVFHLLVFHLFDPEKTSFRHISKVNPRLLQDIVKCYRHSKIVCKFCFYHHKLQIFYAGKTCKHCKRQCEKLVLIPASRLCQNFGNFSVVPIPSPPRLFMEYSGASISNKPFQYCQKEDHFKCYEKSAVNEVWYAHSIEELVIWTFERHYSKFIMSAVRNM